MLPNNSKLNMFKQDRFQFNRKGPHIVQTAVSLQSIVEHMHVSQIPYLLYLIENIDRSFSENKIYYENAVFKEIHCYCKMAHVTSKIKFYDRLIADLVY